MPIHVHNPEKPQIEATLKFKDIHEFIRLAS